MNINVNKHMKLLINKPDDTTKIAKLCYSLASTDRIRVFKTFLYHPKSISTISQETGISISTVSRYVQDLADAGLISITYQPVVSFCKRLPYFESPGTICGKRFSIPYLNKIATTIVESMDGKYKTILKTLCKNSFL